MFVIHVSLFCFASYIFCLTLALLFCLDHSLYKKKPAEYMGHLIGHEGEGSVLSALRYRRWATGISAGVYGLGYNSSSCCAMFVVNITLTKVKMIS